MTGITPDILLHAYAQGIFPMAESAQSDEIYWVDPELRGVFPLDKFHVPKKLARTIRQDIFDVRIDTAFEQVINFCAQSGRDETWINPEIIDLYLNLHEKGFVHSVECWQDGKLVGGLYGVALGGAFCGESMFHKVTDASKVALVHLVARLKVGGFTLLDTQFITPHLSQFGAEEIPRLHYRRELEKALIIEADFYSLDNSSEGSSSGSSGSCGATILQSVTQIS